MESFYFGLQARPQGISAYNVRSALLTGCYSTKRGGGDGGVFGCCSGWVGRPK